MPESRRIRLTLEIYPGEPMAGQVGPSAGPLEPFSGWIGLAAALDRARRDLDAADDRVKRGKPATSS